jgi:hypothetical protein
MWRERFGFEFGMELAAEKPGMVRGLDDFDVLVIGRAAGNAQARAYQFLLEIAVEFVAVAVALADINRAVGSLRE